MRAVLIALLHFTLSFFRSRQSAAFEIVALRHQLAVLQRQTKRPRLTSSDRMLWVALRRLWPKWQQALVIPRRGLPGVVVKPATVIGWHRAGFRAAGVSCSSWWPCG
jgi:hypothetical protein